MNDVHSKNCDKGNISTFKCSIILWVFNDNDGNQGAVIRYDGNLFKCALLLYGKIDCSEGNNSKDIKLQ